MACLVASNATGQGQDSGDCFSVGPEHLLNVGLCRNAEAAHELFEGKGLLLRDAMVDGYSPKHGWIPLSHHVSLQGYHTPNQVPHALPFGQFVCLFVCFFVCLLACLFVSCLLACLLVCVPVFECWHLHV